MELSFTGERKQVIKVATKILTSLEVYSRRVKNLLERDNPVEIERSLVRDITWELHSRFAMRVASQIQPHLLCSLNNGRYKFTVPYDYEKPRFCTICVSRTRTQFSTCIDENGDFLFARILYLLGTKVEALRMPVTINNETLSLGYWFAAYIARFTGDEASYNMYHDEGLDANHS